MGGKDEAAGMAALLRCQEADAILEACAAENVMEVTDPVMGGDETSHMRWEMPGVNGSYVFGELQGLEVTYTEDSGASDTIVNPQVFKRIPEDVQPKLFQAGWWVKGAGGEPIKIWG